MTNQTTLFNDFHWAVDVLQVMDAGLVILDKNFNIQLWNAFMQNHSGIEPAKVLGSNLFKRFPELSKPWFLRKAKPVFELDNTTFIQWQYHPHLFNLTSKHPLMSEASNMFQNCKLSPLKNKNGQIDCIALFIYDATEEALLHGKQT